MNLLRSVSLLALASLALSARAVDAYSNLGSPVAYAGPDSQKRDVISQDGLANLNVAIGFQFAATATGTLSGFQVAINRFDDTMVDQGFSLDLYADSGSDTLGLRLGSYGGTSTGVVSTNTALATVAAGGAPVLLVNGAKYWLVASIPSSNISNRALRWNRSNASAASPTILVITGFSSSTRYASDTPSAFSVQVDPVPEPASFAALGLGAVAVLCRRKRA